MSWQSVDRRTGLAGPRPAALFVEIVLGGRGGELFGNGESTVLYKYMLVPGDFSFVKEGKVLLETYLRTLHISKYMTVELVLHAAELRLRGNFRVPPLPTLLEILISYHAGGGGGEKAQAFRCAFSPRHQVKDRFTKRPRELAASSSQNISSASSDYAISYIDIGVHTFSKGR